MPAHTAITSFVSVVLTFQLLVVGGAAIASPILPGTGGNTLIAAGPNFLTVTEVVTDIGGGEFKYTYSFSNDDPSEVWHFSIYLEFAELATQVEAIGMPNDSSISRLMDSVSAPYDARNIDPDITSVAHMWFGPPFATNGLLPGESASLSFVAGVLDLNPKLFAYETIASGYAGSVGGSHEVAAMGYTVPEPSSALLVSLGLVSLGSYCRRGPRRRS